ncbi:MAG: nucleotidyltransferase substrate binding protein [Kiritimatiellia bacterium]
MRDLRWKQRFSNFERAYALLESVIDRDNLSEVERAGLIKFFEMAFELSWKLLEDYLSSEGYDVKSPRDAIKQAFQIGLIEDGRLWLVALEDRNLTTHTYDAETAIKVERSIKESYAPLIRLLYNGFKDKVKHVERS